MIKRIFETFITAFEKDKDVRDGVLIFIGIWITLVVLASLFTFAIWLV